MVDDLIFDDDRYKDPRARPHQLFLGGDQIYADDVSSLHMLVVMERAMHLIGAPPDRGAVARRRGPAAVRAGRARPVDRVRVFREGAVVDPADPSKAYDDAPRGRRRATCRSTASAFPRGGGSRRSCATRR